jgi:hypothetical protein
MRIHSIKLVDKLHWIIIILYAVIFNFGRFHHDCRFHIDISAGSNDIIFITGLTDWPLWRNNLNSHENNMYLVNDEIHHIHEIIIISVWPNTNIWIIVLLDMKRRICLYVLWQSLWWIIWWNQSGRKCWKNFQRKDSSHVLVKYLKKKLFIHLKFGIFNLVR